jgi:hypothetical protein
MQPEVGPDQEGIAAAQRRLPRIPSQPRTRQEYRIVARWWELEARRMYESATSSVRYAQNMRWAAELAGLYGPGPWLELIARAGVKNPEAGKPERR